MDEHAFSTLKEHVVRLIVEQENTERRMEQIEKAILLHMEQGERITEKISAQLGKLNNAVVAIMVAMFIVLGKDLPSFMQTIF